jgi:N-acyl homoserine lactone hydrolase
MLALEDIVPLRVCAFPYPAAHPLAGRTGVDLAFAVRHSAGVGLYDTGFGRGHAWVDEVLDPRCDDIRDLMRATGIEASEVRWIVHSHLHFDHCGYDRFFPGVPVLVQRAELDAAKAESYTIAEWAFFDGVRHVALDGDTEIASGVRALATPGHTPGHQSLAVETTSGIAVIAGHAVFSAAEWRRDASPMETSEDSRRSADRLRALDPRAVFFSHDDDVWRKGTPPGRAGHP